MCIVHIINRKVSLSQIQVLLLHHPAWFGGTEVNHEGIGCGVTSSLSNKVALIIGQV
jgi:hypothetical protein